MPWETNNIWVPPIKVSGCQKLRIGLGAENQEIMKAYITILSADLMNGVPRGPSYVNQGRIDYPNIHWCGNTSISAHYMGFNY
jgi:hypothetical protein